MKPRPLALALPTYQTVHQDAEWHPEQQGEGQYRANHVVSQELPQRVDVQLFYEVPQPLYYILHLLHALALGIGSANTHTHSSQPGPQQQ